MAFPNTTKAIVTHPPKDGKPTWAISPIALRDPKDNEVLVRIVASGVCHTDVYFSTLAQEHSAYPKILGHEGAGVVEKIGCKISHVKPGDRVLLSIDYCDEVGCYNCAEEVPGCCTKLAEKNFACHEIFYELDGGSKVAGGFFGQSSFGGRAVVQEKSVINVDTLVRNDDELTLFAPFGCGFQTGAGAVTNLADVGHQSAVGVFGLGGVGRAAVMAAKMRGATTIIGVDRIQSRLDVAKDIGATHVINTSPFTDLTVDLGDAIRSVVGSGTNFNIDTTGVSGIIRAGIDSLHSRGQLILIGIINGQPVLPLDLAALLSGGKSIRGCVEGNVKPSKYAPQLIQWYREGKLPIEKLIKHYPADDFAVALADMHDGSTIKPVLIW